MQPLLKALTAALIHYFTENYGATVLNYYTAQLASLSDKYSFSSFGSLEKVQLATICKGPGV